MQDIKKIVVYTLPAGPNAWKVIVILEELGLPYETKNIKFQDVKSEPFISVNPNGRAPAIEDPNTKIVLWESAAIILYLIEQYDSKKLLTHNTLKERHLQNQWLSFQVSGQGPYFGQASWFNVLHHERLPSASERYNSEIKRILGVLEASLQGPAGSEWLVGDKMTYADLSFVPWNQRLDDVVLTPPGQKKVLEGFPKVKAWHERMTNRPAWVRSMKLRDQLMDEQGLQPNGVPKGVSVEEFMKDAS